MRSPALALVAVAALLAGCGSGDQTSKPSARSDYEHALRGVVAKVRETGDTPAALQQAAERLRGIRPPREVVRPHRDLTAGFAAVAEARASGTEVPDDVADRILAARRAYAVLRYDVGVYGPLR